MNNSLNNKKKSIEEIISLFKPNDELAVPLATGQPETLLNALSQRNDWEHLDIFSGLMTFPYPILLNPNVYITSGYFGPLERMLNSQGAHIDYLPSDFSGFESYAIKKNYRIVATTLSEPDSEGFLTFGSHGAAVYKPFLKACKDKNQIAIAEINKKMPIVYGLKEFGDNKIHIDDINYCFESDVTQPEIPVGEIKQVEQAIAENVMNLITSKSTLQFGIGGTPNHLASLLAKSSLSDFGIHSELISDGFLELFDAGKISNKHKGVFEDCSVFTFAFGSQKLYDFLDERNKRNNRKVVCLPVSIVNNPYYISKNNNMISINSGIMIDFAGQVCSEAIGLKQYSGVGGQFSFVQGAYDAQDGKSIMCIKSTATVNGKQISNIVPTLPQGSLISTPRHYCQYIATEYGVVNLYGVPDDKRPEKLISIAHPNFRDELKEKYEELKKAYYHS